MSVLRRDDISVDGNSGFGEEATEGSELGVGVGVGIGAGAGLFDFGRWLHSDGTAAAATVTDGEERGLLRILLGFEN